MSPPQVEPIVSSWIDEYRTLGSRDFINHVQIFENRGLIMGCSNPHPHGQIWASSTVPNLPARELSQQQRYLDEHGSCLLCSYLAREGSLGERLLFENDSFVVLVPYWASWPFETMIIPRRHSPALETLSEAEKKDLAAIMIELGICYDNLFQTSFPYSMGIHQQPTDGGDYPGVHFHFHYLPPLLRSPTIKKHMVGFELLATVQRDLTPETAAARLRELPRTHYLEGPRGR
jgi:UDPglucose--hexose-1-phosphate uridylyltransferase